MAKRSKGGPKKYPGKAGTAAETRFLQGRIAAMRTSSTDDSDVPPAGSVKCLADGLDLVEKGLKWAIHNEVKHLLDRDQGKKAR